MIRWKLLARYHATGAALAALRVAKGPYFATLDRAGQILRRAWRGYFTIFRRIDVARWRAEVEIENGR